MITLDYPEVKEALAIQAEQRALDVRQQLNQSKLKAFLLKNSHKGCMRIVIDNKIVTISTSNGGRVVQIHVSDLDGVAT